MSNLIYIHIGTKLPAYIYDSIYQTLIVSSNTKIYLLLTDSLIKECKNTINKFNINLYTKNKFEYHLNIEYIPLSILYSISLQTFKDNQKYNFNTEFRDHFWIYTTERFFYLETFMKLYQITNCFYIENDVMIYDNLSKISIDVSSKKLYLLKDSPNRVIPSIIYIPNYNTIHLLNNFILSQIKIQSKFLNDMDLLALYTNENPENTNYFPFKLNETPYIFDGASIGQYLGGIDPRNLSNFENKTVLEQKLITFSNHTIGFINETCELTPNDLNIYHKNTYVHNFLLPITLPMYSNSKQIFNLHIHSKQLYQFNSTFNIKFNDIISGDRICGLCNFILTTPDIYNYHKNLTEFIDISKIIIIKDFSNINIKALNNYFHNYFKEIGVIKQPIKLFIYTHILDLFVEKILYNLDRNIQYILYIHNSDHSLENPITYDKLKNAKHIVSIYSQNINCELNNKFNIIPIGIANNCFTHGNILSLYEIMSQTYYLNKVQNIYININPNTYHYRKIILDELNKKKNFNITCTPKPYNEYLKELSLHRFCLCIRGNGFDTHRFFESLYLGVIPVIINNKHTNMDNHVKYLKKSNLPFYEIKDDNLDKYTDDDFFNEDLYKKIIKYSGFTIQNNPALKLTFYHVTN